METSTKQGVTIVFRCENACRNVWPSFSDTVNQQNSPLSAFSCKNGNKQQKQGI